MHKQLLTLCISFLLFFVSVRNVNANIFINEVFPNPVEDEIQNEWIELYNNSNEEININGFKLIDAAEHELVISELYTDGVTVIHPMSWLVVQRKGHTTFALNNSGTETIYLKNNIDNTLIDTFSYTDSVEEKSWGRSPDGGGLLTSVLDPTKGTSNNKAVTPTEILQNSDIGSTGKAYYKINDVKDGSGNIITNVKISVDGNYIHHYAPETIEFCDGCDCSGYTNCCFGTHKIVLERSGYEAWSESINIKTGDNLEANPTLKMVFTPTPNPIFVTSDKPTPTKPSVLGKTDEEEFLKEDGDKVSIDKTISDINDKMTGQDINKEVDGNKIEDDRKTNENKYPVAALMLILGGISFFVAAAYPFMKNSKYVLKLLNKWEKR